MEFLKVTLKIARSRPILILFIAIILSASPPVEAKKLAGIHGPVAVARQSAPEISYKVSAPKPSSHLIDVEMTVKWANMPRLAELKMAVWTPGSYLVREYARHVQEFAVASGSRN